MTTWRLALTVLSVAFVSALFAALVVRLTQSDSGTAFVSAIQAGDKPAAPQFDLAVMWPHSQTWPARLQPKVADRKIALRDLQGFPIVLNFWASWCTACGDEASLLRRTAHKDRNKVVFVGINIHDLGSDARQFLEQHHENYVSLRTSSLWEDYGLIGLPETYYLDRKGRVVGQTIGELTQRKLQAGISRAMRD
jgi:cytochrome c biogenesis protein CcmG, thiol:disulfide interchange protein DsbE